VGQPNNSEEISHEEPLNQHAGEMAAQLFISAMIGDFSYTFLVLTLSSPSHYIVT
jgi:hypothetical protein